MARLLNTQTNTITILRSQHIFGRHSASSNTILDNPEASRLHASILWNGSCWWLQDTSSNGTYLNGKPVATGLRQRIKKGDTIQFGSSSASEWLMTHDDAPKSLLVSISHAGETVELQGVMGLPNGQSPEVTLYQLSDGRWVCEHPTGVEELSSGSQITTSEAAWYYVDADTFDSTRQAEHGEDEHVEPSKINFTVSKDEEHVSLTIEHQQGLIDLGERTHHYLLLFLARQRIHDQQQGLEDSEQGWIDKSLLTQQVGLSEKHINIHIYRFRKQLIQARPNALQLLQIIERRRGALRFAYKSVAINGGNDLIQQNQE